MNAARLAYQIVRRLGTRFVWTRTTLAVKNRLGLTRRRFALDGWTSIDLATILKPGVPHDPDAFAAYKRANEPRFLFPLGRPPEVPGEIKEPPGGRCPGLPKRVRLLQDNRVVYFHHAVAPEPIDWYANPFDHTRGPSRPVWCDIPDFAPGQGDARTLWEPSRAAWAVDIVRARARGLDVDAGSLFWRWVDSWMAACPPFRGFQWKSGQEAAIRFMAIAMGFWAVGDDKTTTPERWRQLTRLAWATGHRIFGHLAYAVSQKNNHALSEATGLMLVAHLFPELRDAKRWDRAARRALEREWRRQIYADGSYVQHSMNYHRLMLQVSALAVRLAELAERPFPRDVYDRLGAAAAFLNQLIESKNGRVPQYGHDDGSLVWPLNECDFTDFRPVIQLTHYLVHRRRLDWGKTIGPWDEDLVWLFGRDAIEGAPVARLPSTSTAFPDGGYYTLRNGRSWAMIRCHAYRDRPSHCDPLHVDLWIGGTNVARDCGTYKYYTPGRPDVEAYFKSIAAHNTIEIDGQSPMEPVSRFLFLPWLSARVRRFDVEDDSVQCFEGEHDGYNRPPWHVVHRRCVLALPDDVWLIVDDLIGRGAHRAILRWHLTGAPVDFDADGRRWVVRFDDDAAAGCVEADPPAIERFEIVKGRDDRDRVQGFASDDYGERFGIPTIEVEAALTRCQRLVTAVAPGESIALRLEGVENGVQAWSVSNGSHTTTVRLAAPTRRIGSVYVGVDAHR